ncbi:MAG: SBBP repeat-containing protein, partial [Proteobacteria bacterium]|nr:SBBP repeat-containing protein [Pseudomonadota bacterium]
MIRKNIFVLYLGALLAWMAGAPNLSQATEAETIARVSKSLAKLPLLFVENRGQFDPEVAYTVQGATTSLFFTPGGVTFALSGPAKKESSPLGGLVKASLSSKPERWAVKLDFLGANPAVKPQAEALQEGVVSYFTGSEDQWQTGIKTYGKIRYPNLWPGIDLVYSGTAERLKYQFELKPGADPKLIRLAYRGASSVTATDAGQLEVATPVRSFQDEKPIAWQEIDGWRVDVSAAYALQSKDKSGHPYGFRLGSYDPSRPLILDPAVFVYGGYIGGAKVDQGHAIVVDTQGNAYVTGYTTSYNFPVKVGPDLNSSGIGILSGSAFVAKVKADGSALVYAGYIGGSREDVGNDIAVDAAGNAYVTGNTNSDEGSFPVKGGPDLTFNGNLEAFIVKVNAEGTGLVYAGYIGGNLDDDGASIAVDGLGNAYVTGGTCSDQTSFPVKLGPDLTYNGAYNDGYCNKDNMGDAYVAKVNTDGTLVYAGYIGGSVTCKPNWYYNNPCYSKVGGLDRGKGIAVDAAGNAYVAGTTTSATNFPVKGGPDLTFNGDPSSFWTDAFVAKVNATGTALVYAGFIGGTHIDIANGIAVDTLGNAYVTGETWSDQNSFPVKVGPDLTFNNGYADAFLAKVNTTGTDLVYAGYLGGSGKDSGVDIAVDSGGNAYVTGVAQPGSLVPFPVKNGPDLTHNGLDDAFVSMVNAAGTDLVYSGWIGGNGYDVSRGIAVDGEGNAYVTGKTNSSANFPLKVGPDLTYNDSSDADAFVVKISAMPLGQAIVFGPAPAVQKGRTGLVSAMGGGSNNPLTLTSLTPSVCTVAGNTVTGITVGTCTLAADQLGNAKYDAAAQATLDIAIGQAGQSISFGPAPSVIVSGTGPVSATGGASGNPVTFSSTTPAVCSTGGTNGSSVMGVTVGNCIIAANQSGNASYNAAPQVTQTIAIGKAEQSITFGATPTVIVGGTGSASATGGLSGNPVTFSSTTTGVCTVSGPSVTGVTAGTCTIAADQAGNANYNAADQATLAFTVNKANQ